MGKIIIEVKDFNKKISNIYKFNSSLIRIGRDFNNDIILQDIHVSSKHLKLEMIKGQLHLFNTNNENLTYKLDKSKKETFKSDFIIKSGDSFKVGKSIITIYNNFHKTEPTKLIVSEKKILFNTILSIFSIAMLIMMFFNNYFNLHQNFKKEYIGAIIAYLFLGTIWVGIWTFVTWIIKKKFNLKKQIFNFAFAFTSFSIIYWLNRLLVYNNPNFNIVYFILFFFILSYFIFSHLKTVLPMKKGKNLIIAIILTAIISYTFKYEHDKEYAKMKRFILPKWGQFVKSQNLEKVKREHKEFFESFEE